MTRYWPVIVVLTASLHAVAAVGPVTAPTRISSPVFVAAPDFQGDVRMAFNGTEALAAWNDWRTGTNEVFASPLDADGRSLDPFGIRVARGSVDAVVVDADGSFVVATHDVEKALLTRVRIDGSGTAGESRRPDIPRGAMLIAASSSAGRLLYIRWMGDSIAYSILDASGDVLVRDVPLPPVDDGYGTSGVVAAGRGQEFLIVRNESPATNLDTTRSMSFRIGAKGEIVSLRNAGVFSHYGRVSLTAGATTYLLEMQQQRAGQDEYVTYKLDESGVFTGQTQTITPAAPGAANGSVEVVASLGDLYSMSWITAPSASREQQLMELQIGSLEPPRVISRWANGGYLSSAYSTSSSWIIFISAEVDASSYFDLYAQAIRPDGTTVNPKLLAVSGTLQSHSVVAPTPGGYAVAWAEQGIDNQSLIYARTIAAAGTFDSEFPFEVARVKTDPHNPILPAIRIAANRTTLFFVWTEDSFVKLRRKSIGGEWIDPTPISVSAADAVEGIVDVSANEHAAVIAWGAIGNNVLARAFTSAGDLLPAIEVMAVLAGDIAIATDSDDFLISVAETYTCFFECAPAPTRSLARRVNVDGQPVGTMLTLSGPNSFVSRIAVAWNERFLVVWAGGDHAYGAYVSRDGENVEKQTPIAGSTGIYVADVALATNSDSFLLLTRSIQQAGESEWAAVAIPANTPLSTAASLDHRSVVSLPPTRWGSAYAAGFGARFMIVLDRVDEIAGHVPRVFAQLFGESGRRRAVRR